MVPPAQTVISCMSLRVTLGVLTVTLTVLVSVVSQPSPTVAVAVTV